MSNEHESDAADQEREQRIAYGLARVEQHGNMKRAAEESGIPRRSLQRAHERLTTSTPAHSKEVALQAQEDRIRQKAHDVALKSFEQLDERISTGEVETKVLVSTAGMATDKVLALKPQSPEADFASNLLKGLHDAGMLKLEPMPTTVDAVVVSDHEVDSE